MSVFQIFVLKLILFLDNKGYFLDYTRASDSEPFFYNQIKGYQMIRIFALEKNVTRDNLYVFCLYAGRHRFTWYKQVKQGIPQSQVTA